MPRGQPLNTMNPFSNNKPRLTASERIRNKRDAAIYQGEKQRFQRGKNKCRNRNVKFYRNGKVRSVVNYKMQNSLARGNVLCNDCDDKGNLCAAPSKKDDFASIYMGNNAYSEYWGGARVDLGSGSGGIFTQTVGLTTINSDVSGSWGGSLTNISKSDLSGAFLPGSDPSLNMPFGYLNNLIDVPRNLDGSGIVIDPSNVLFPNELCDPFRYLAKSYLKTYLIIRAPITEPDRKVGGVNIPIKSTSCFSDFLYKLIGRHCILQPVGIGPAVASGIISSICCVGKIPKYDALVFGSRFSGDDIGLFDIYIELFYLQDPVLLSNIMNTINNTVYKPYGSFIENLGRLFPLFEIAVIPEETFLNNTGIFGYHVQSLKLIQGSIPPSMNQTLYNSTKQSYMYCLENGTRKINFTKQNTRIPVKNAFCTPSIPIPPSPPACVPEITFTIQLIIGTPVLPTFETLSDGKYLLFDIGPSNTNTTWNFNIIDISNSCPGEPANLKIDYLVVGGGGSGGYVFGPGQRGTTGGGGGGGVQQGTLPTLSGGTTYNFQVEVGAGSPGTYGTTPSNLYPARFVTDASFSRLKLDSTLIASANPGVNGALVTYPNSSPVVTNQGFLVSTEGGGSGGFTGGRIINPSNGNQVDGSSNPVVFGSAGGGGSNQDGSNNGVFGDTNTWYIDNNGRYFTSGGNGGDGVSSSITGSTVSYGGGGGGGAIALNGTTAQKQRISAGLGGEGGGGNGGLYTIPATPGSPGTQYGGGGGGSGYGSDALPTNGGAGYRGVVILKFYKAPA